MPENEADSNKKSEKKEGKAVFGAARETVVSADLPSDDSRPQTPKPKKKE